MKAGYVALLALIIAVGCGKENPASAGESNTTQAKPVKAPTLEDIIGTYDQKDEGNIFRAVFLEGGTTIYTNDKNETREYKWEIKEGEVHIEYEEFVGVYRISSNGDLYATMAVYENGLRKHIPKEDQKFMKKLNQSSDD